MNTYDDYLSIYLSIYIKVPTQKVCGGHFAGRPTLMMSCRQLYVSQTQENKQMPLNKFQEGFWGIPITVFTSEAHLLEMVLRSETIRGQNLIIERNPPVLRQETLPNLVVAMRHSF